MKSKIQQSDYDAVVKYIKSSFPKATSMQRDIEMALKRTFVLDSPSTSSNLRKTKKPKRNPKLRRLVRVKPVPRVIEYDRFGNLNRMWNDYVDELLKDTDSSKIDVIQQKLSRVDLHGAFIEVVQSNCPDLIGLKGIVIKETKNTFALVTKSNVTKTVPKSESEFRVEIRRGCITLAGNSFLTRPAERATKKIKSFMEFVGQKVYRNTLRYTKTKKTT